MYLATSHLWVRRLSWEMEIDFLPPCRVKPSPPGAVGPIIIHLDRSAWTVSEMFFLPGRTRAVPTRKDRTFGVIRLLFQHPKRVWPVTRTSIYLNLTNLPCLILP